MIFDISGYLEPKFIKSLFHRYHSGHAGHLSSTKDTSPCSQSHSLLGGSRRISGNFHLFDITLISFQKGLCTYKYTFKIIM